MLILTDNHLDAIKYILEGKNTSEIAKLCNVSRTAIYNWLGDKDFKAELEKQRQDVKNNANAEIVNKLGCYINILHEIATTSKNDKERRAACEYLVDRALGKATTRVADISEDDNKEKIEDIDSIIADLEKDIV